MFVARRKRSAPAKHPVRGAGEASEICLIGAARAAFAGASFARCSRSFVTPRYGVVARLTITLCNGVARFRGWRYS